MDRRIRRPPGRDRMVATAAGLFGRRGVDGTSFDDILTASGAPRGSIYYYFPQGKRELVADAVQWTTEAVRTYQETCRARTPGGVIAHFVGFFRRSLAGSECRSGCPLAAVAIGSYGPTEVLRGAVRHGFRSWESLLATQLRTTGLAPRTAQTLATSTVASVEGALILARAEGTIRPLDVVGRELRERAEAVHRTRRGRREDGPRLRRPHIQPFG